MGQKSEPIPSFLLALGMLVLTTSFLFQPIPLHRFLRSTKEDAAAHVSKYYMLNDLPGSYRGPSS